MEEERGSSTLHHSKTPRLPLHFSMATSWDIHELAVLSLDGMLFGVDASQIQEILRIQRPAFLTMEADEDRFCILHHQRTQIPIFDLRHYFHLPPAFSHNIPPQIFTGITFYSGNRLIVCQVSGIKNIMSPSVRSLQAVPHILKQFARKMHLWGFYTYSDDIIPLFDLEYIVPENMLFRYRQNLS
ncbi:hypothetical protein CSA56_15840 [candidate division KSB3 bacterium]|uniref:CheW-like domain-containing protein n=1 Tax=candidate division KSB3 bacterium TaxID=2044937 RepID=A0A2G6K9J9_9BACT|nr:MAG: hypothetical protein CSA56_15840 [candidate division KSB3 bacterium]